jgi:hypothetical protein
MRYHHRQVGWLTLFAFLVTGILVIRILHIAMQAGLAGFGLVLLLAGAAVLTGCAVIFSGLTISISSGRLAWYFGPGWPRWSVPLGEVTGAERIRPPIWWGYGIRFTPSGWMYNVSGRDAVLVRRGNGKHFILGTDDPYALIAAIESAAADSSPGTD